MSDVLMPDFIDGCAASRHWKAAFRGFKGGKLRTVGICIPLSSIRSARSCGMGDVADLYEMIDFCSEIGAGLLQLLPVNDAGYDGVPYAALSAFALDPAYAALDRIPGLEHDAAFIESVARVARTFDTVRIDNPAVRRARESLLRDGFVRVRSDSLHVELRAFIQSNKWVRAYAAFKVIREREDFRCWENWSAVHAGPPHEIIESLENTDEFMFHVFCQWLLDSQFSAAHEYARQKGVLLEGDIPILVARDSADVWARPDMFHLEFAAGAPPDMYSEDGQHWGFPTYRWAVIRDDDYSWWRSRLLISAKYFDLYRIDHVVGFFRIWTIGINDRNGRNGWFDPADESLWGEHGRTILSVMLDATDMLPLAEDLGTIPDICRTTLRDMGICGLKVQRWEKYWKTDSRFIRPLDYDPISVATLSTHDCDIVADWWAGAGEAERAELWQMMGCTGTAPSYMDRDAGMRLIEWFCDNGSSFVVLAIQDVLYPFGLLPGPPSDHRINLPGTVGPLNWSWRCPVTTRQLLTDSTLTETIRGMINPS